MAATITIVQIDGLQEDQRNALIGVKVGDALLFVKRQELVAVQQDDDADSDVSHNSSLVMQDDTDTDTGDEESDNDDNDASENDSNEVEVDASVVSASSSVTGHESEVQLEHDEQRTIVGGTSSNEKSDSETDTQPTSEEDVEDSVDASCVYVVVSLKVDDSGALTDIGLIKLSYDATCEDAHSYQVYGSEISYVLCQDCVDIQSILQLGGEGGLKDFTLLLNPDGDYIRTQVLSEPTCLVGCNGGWLDSLEELAQCVHRQVYVSPATMPHLPVCPGCIGLELLREQQALRLLLEANQIDIGEVIEFTGRLNVRRGPLGLEFYQFDERAWGMVFDDMMSDDGDMNGHAGYGGGWEQWEEALDPAAEVNIKYRPASDAAIAALPKTKYEDAPAPVNGTEKATICMVCMEDYNNDTIIVVLPCGHYSCDGPCTEQWLKQYDSCPTCRAKVTDEKVTTTAPQLPANNGAEGGNIDGGAGELVETTFAESVESAMGDIMQEHGW